MCVDRLRWIVEAERRLWTRQLKVGFVERSNGPDVLPVIVEKMPHDPVVAKRPWDKLAAEIDMGGVQQGG